MLSCVRRYTGVQKTTDIPPQITTPDSVDTSIGTLNFFDGVPDRATVETVYDYMDRARAAQVFVNLATDGPTVAEMPPSEIELVE